MPDGNTARNCWKNAPGFHEPPLHVLMKVGGLLHSEAAISVNGRMTKVKIIRTVARAGRFCRFGMAPTATHAAA